MHTIFVFKNGEKIKYFKYNGMRVDLDSRLSIERALAWAIETMNATWKDATWKVEKIEHYTDETYENLIESIELAQEK